MIVWRRPKPSSLQILQVCPLERLPPQPTALIGTVPIWLIDWLFSGKTPQPTALICTVPYRIWLIDWLEKTPQSTALIGHCTYLIDWLVRGPLRNQPPWYVPQLFDWLFGEKTPQPTVWGAALFQSCSSPEIVCCGWNLIWNFLL